MRNVLANVCGEYPNTHFMTFSNSSSEKS